MTFLLGRFGAVTLACGLALASGAALAQTAPRRPPPSSAAPPQAAPQPAGPVKLDLQPMQSPWTKICGKDQGNNKEVCYTTRDFGQSLDQPPTLAVAIYQMQGEEKRIARFLLPVALMIQAGLSPDHRQGRADRRQIRDLFPERLFRRSRAQQPIDRQC